MDFEAVADVVDGHPHMRRRAGRKVYDHIVSTKAHRVLELGAFHGVSTCYLAAAVDELGSGHVTTMDRVESEQLDPNVFQLLERTDLRDHVDVVLAQRSFTWELKRLLEREERPQYDFVFLDGGHVWDVTGFAFFLVDQLLAPGGWLLFDDLKWSYATSPSLKDLDDTMAIPEEERTAQQVRAVFDVLVARHGDYTTELDGNWGWAQKLRPTPPANDHGRARSIAAAALDRLSGSAASAASRIRATSG
ncbi:MAG: class I SAM-dependent methyltransferase [Ilumatobacter sp.]